MNFCTNLLRGLWQLIATPVVKTTKWLRDLNSREFRSALENLQMTATVIRKLEEKRLEEEQMALGESITLKLNERFKARKFDGYYIRTVPKNISAYSIYIFGQYWDGFENVQDMLIIHIDLHQPMFPIIIRGLYSSGVFGGEDEYFPKDPVSVAKMIHRICERIKAGGYLIRPPLAHVTPVDLTRLVLM